MPYFRNGQPALAVRGLAAGGPVPAETGSAATTAQDACPLPAKSHAKPAGSGAAQPFPLTADAASGHSLRSAASRKARARKQRSMKPSCQISMQAEGLVPCRTASRAEPAGHGGESGLCAPCSHGTPPLPCNSADQRSASERNRLTGCRHSAPVAPAIWSRQVPHSVATAWQPLSLTTPKSSAPTFMDTSCFSFLKP